MMKDFADTGYNPATHKVAGVVLVDGVTLCDQTTLVDGVTLCDQTTLVDGVTLCDQTTLVDTVTTNSDLVTAAAVKTAIEAANGDLDLLVRALVNKLIITEASGNTEMFDDADSTLGSVATAFTSDGTYTTRLRMVP